MKLAVNLLDYRNLDKFLNYDIDSFLICDKYYSSSPNGMTNRDIKKTIFLSHKNNKKVIVKVDRLYQQSEIKGLIAYLHFLNESSADAILFSDVALIPISKQEHLKMQTIYAPETLLTNQYDVKQMQIDGVDNCVISKDIPLESVYRIVEENKDYCFFRIHGPILISYSKRRFISTYLNKKREYLDSYYLQEESRELKMPIVEKKTGSWLYYGSLESFNEYESLKNKSFASLIIDNIFYNDEYTLKVLDLYLKQEISYDEKIESLKNTDKDIEYISISSIKMTQLDKE